MALFFGAFIVYLAASNRLATYLGFMTTAPAQPSSNPAPTPTVQPAPNSQTVQ